MTNSDGHLEARRKTILTAAARVFDAHGYAATKMDAIAAEAGVSKGSLYNYFENKQDLFMQVFGAELASYHSDATRVLTEPTSAGEKLAKLLDDWFERMGHLRRVGGLMLEFWATAAREQTDGGGLSETFGQMYEGWCSLLADIVAGGIEQGEFSPQFDPKVAASLIVAMGDGITMRSILDERMVVDEKLLEAMKRAIISGLSAGQQSGPTGREELQNEHQTKQDNT